MNLFGSNGLRRSLWICAGLLALGAMGCALPGAIAYKVAGPPPVDAKYTPTSRPTLVLAENYSQGGAMEQDADSLADLVLDTLREHSVCPTIDSGSLMELRSSHADEFRNMTIPQVGRAVGAKQVLYIDVRNSSIEMQTDDLMHGSMQVRVRFVDVATGDTLWPETSQGYPLSIDKSFVRVADEHDKIQFRQDMLHSMSESIANLFYKHKPEEQEQERTDQQE